MSNRYPLECICSHRAEPFQLVFAQQAIQFLPPRLDRSVAASHKGLTVGAETEPALAAAVQILKNVYGEQLRIGKFMIRYRRGAVIEEPHMGVRVQCLASHFIAVRDDLLARGAAICDAELAPPIGVVRATVSLAKLLGYAQHLAELTDARAREVMWLSHYAPVEPPPPGGCAA
jgi:hypothetical protein